MANTEIYHDFRIICDSINDLSSRKNQFIQREKWGEITFADAQNDIDTVFWIVEELRRLPFFLIPDGNIANSTQYLMRIKSILDQIDNFTLIGDAASTRDSIINELSRNVENLMSEVGIWLPLLALRSGEIQNWAARMRSASVDMTKILQETQSASEKGLEDIKASVEAARVAAGEAGAAEFTHEFREESKLMEKRGQHWLFPTAALAISALALSVSLMFGLFEQTPTNTWDAVYRIGGRVIAISVLFYAAIWSGRIVLANMHLASVNKHRAVSLQTLQAFHQAAEDPAARDAVVLEAARAVYENVPSGYIGRQAAEHGGHGRTLEIIKNAGQGVRQDGD